MATNSQIYIFFGEDDFSLRQKLDRWKQEFAKKYSPEAVVLVERGEDEVAIINALDQATSPSLFAAKKLVIARDCLPKKASETRLGDYILNLIDRGPENAFVVFWETARPDRRLGAVKKIFAAKANQTEFTLPHGRVLNAWIKAYAKLSGATMDEEAIEALAVYLGRDLYEEKKIAGRVVDRREAFDLWQAHSEIRKLSAYSPSITAAAVKALVKPRVPENVFALTDELVKKDRRKVFEILEQLLGQSNTDEKSSVIKIVGLLAEHIRSLLLIKIMQEARLAPEAMADKLGWSSGRVYVLTKNAAAQSLPQLRKLVDRLAEIDLKLKSSDDNPRLLLDQFVVAACV